MNYSEKNTAATLSMLIKTQEWQCYERFISDYIYKHISTSHSKELLYGMKHSIDAVKHIVEKYECKKIL